MRIHKRTEMYFMTDRIYPRICTYIYLVQGLPFHSTIVQKEVTHIAYALLFSRRSDCESAQIGGCYFFFMFTLKNYFMLKNSFFFNSKSYMFLKHILIVLIVK